MVGMTQMNNAYGLVAGIFENSRAILPAKLKFSSMKILTKESLESLLRGIKKLLQEDRCSFSETELALLQDCVEAIEVMLTRTPRRKVDLHDITRIAELIVHVLINVHHRPQN